MSRLREGFIEATSVEPDSLIYDILRFLGYGDKDEFDNGQASTTFLYHAITKEMTGKIEIDKYKIKITKI